LFCSVGSGRFVTQQEGKGAGIFLVFYTSLHCSFRCVFPPFFRMCVVHGAWTDVAISNATTSIVNSSLFSAISVADGSVVTYPRHHLFFYHFVSARERIPFVWEGVPRRAHVRICMSRRWVFRTCSIHILLTGSLYPTTCSSFFTLQTSADFISAETPSSSPSEEITLFCARSCSYYKIAPFHEISQSASSPKRNWLRIFLLLLAMKLIAKVSARSFLLGVWSSEEVVGCKS
jgi:hypothetical protein